MTTHSTIIGATMGATMGAIAALALMVGPAQANVGNPPSRAEVKRMIVQEAEATRVPPALALALAKVESDFQANALSSAGARGVMQIMPATARGEYGVQAELLWQPRINIRLGIHFLRRLIARYHGRVDLALSYYNGGSAVGDLPRARIIPATRNYVKRVKFLQKRYRKEVWSGGYRKWMHKTPSGTPLRRD